MSYARGLSGEFNCKNCKHHFTQHGEVKEDDYSGGHYYSGKKCKECDCPKYTNT